VTGISLNGVPGAQCMKRLMIIIDWLLSGAARYHPKGFVRIEKSRPNFNKHVVLVLDHSFSHSVMRSFSERRINCPAALCWIHVSTNRIVNDRCWINQWESKTFLQSKDHALPICKEPTA
jgi:hypothetical protein